MGVGAAHLGFQEFHGACLRDDRHGVAHKPRKHPEEGVLFLVGRSRRNLADGLGHAVLLDEYHPELETALLEGHGPEATGIDWLAVGIGGRGAVAGHDELAVGYGNLRVELVLE